MSGASPLRANVARPTKMTETRLLISEPPLQVLPSLASAIGLNEALVLQQIHYYAQRQTDRDPDDIWVRRTVEQWHQWPFKFWDTRTIRRVLQRLRERALIVAEADGGSFDKTLRYRVDYGALPLGQVVPIDADISPGQIVPMLKDRRKESNGAVPAPRERVRAPAAVKFSGKAVNADAWALTERVLAEFNSQAGRKYRLMKSSGQPSEAAKRIYHAIRDYPDITFDEHADIIGRVLASRWWGSAEPEFGVVFGLKVFENNITRSGDRELRAPRTVKEAKAVADEAQNKRLREAIMRRRGIK